MNLRLLIRDMPGKNRCDLTQLLARADAFAFLIDRLAAPFAGQRVTHVAGIDALGFPLAGAVAAKLGAGFVAIRKPAKIAWEARSTSFTDYTGQTKSLELAADALNPDARVLLVDDWTEAGAQLAAQLCRAAGATVVGASVLNADPAARLLLNPILPSLHCVIDDG